MPFEDLCRNLPLPVMQTISRLRHTPFLSYLSTSWGLHLDLIMLIIYTIPHLLNTKIFTIWVKSMYYVLCYVPFTQE